MSRRGVRARSAVAWDGATKVADMTVEELADLTRATVSEELECLRDEDEGEVRPEFLSELERRHTSPRKRSPEEEALLELGIGD
jgi:hypothetical protein